MIDRDSLIQIVLIETLLLTVLIALYFAHALQLHRHARAIEPRLVAARRELGAAAADGTSALPVLRSLPPSLQMHLFVELSPSLAGAERMRLGAVGESLGLVARAAALCRSRFEMRRLLGARLLGAMEARHPVLIELLQDTSPWVRAQAAELVLHQPDPAIVDRLIRLLQDVEPICRFSAQDTLLRLETHGVAALAEFLASEADAAALEAALDVAVGLAEARLLEPGLVLSTHARARVRARAAALLGGIGGAAAADRLHSMLADVAAEVRAAAAAGLGHLGHWPAAPKIARLLHDPSWDVRRAAGLALRALGSTGELLLRRLLGDADRLAAEMAQHVLDLPHTAPAAARRTPYP